MTYGRILKLFSHFFRHDNMEKLVVQGKPEGKRKTHVKIMEQYSNISRAFVTAYISQRERCVEKTKKREIKPGCVIKPILAKDVNDRRQVDLVNYQTLLNGPYKYIMHYKEFLTKYSFLRALKSKEA